MRILIGGVLVALAVLGGVWTAGYRADLGSDPQPKADVHAGEIVPQRVFGQSFLAPYEGLHQVAVRFATFGRRNDCRLVFRLYDMQAAFELARVETPCSALPDNRYFNFDFPTVEGSAGKTYLFTLESPDATSGHAVAVWATPSQVYKEGSLFLNFETKPGNLTFKTAYFISLPTVVSIFPGLVAAGKPSLFGDKAFYVLLAVAYVAGMASLVLLCARARS